MAGETGATGAAVWGDQAAYDALVAALQAFVGTPNLTNEDIDAALAQINRAVNILHGKRS
jgi:hypothetical protein